MWTRIYLQKEAANSKHSWKKIMQLLLTIFTYLLKNVKHGIEHDIMTWVIRYSWNLQQIWWIPCNLSRWWIWQYVSLQYEIFAWSVYMEVNFLQALITPEYYVLGSIGIKWSFGYCENTFASLSEWFVNLLLPLPQEIYYLS